MNKFSENDPRNKWPQATKQEFDDYMSALNYRRDSWADVSTYVARDIIVGYYRHATGTWHIRPEDPRS